MAGKALKDERALQPGGKVRRRADSKQPFSSLRSGDPWGSGCRRGQCPLNIYLDRTDETNSGHESQLPPLELCDPGHAHLTSLSLRLLICPRGLLRGLAFM